VNGQQAHEVIGHNGCGIEVPHAAGRGDNDFSQLSGARSTPQLDGIF
jgi:hypothetical protein